MEDAGWGNFLGIACQKWIELAFEIIIKKGITNIHDAWQEPHTVDVIRNLDSHGQLPIRCFGMLGSSYTKLLDRFFKEGIYKSEKYEGPEIVGRECFW